MISIATSVYTQSQYLQAILQCHCFIGLPLCQTTLSSRVWLYHRVHQCKFLSLSSSCCSHSCLLLLCLPLTLPFFFLLVFFRLLGKLSSSYAIFPYIYFRSAMLISLDFDLEEFYQLWEGFMEHMPDISTFPWTLWSHLICCQESTPLCHAIFPDEICHISSTYFNQIFINFHKRTLYASVDPFLSYLVFCKWDTYISI